MSFVINKSQIKCSTFEPPNQNPGPGAYSALNKSIAQLPAPFNSSTYKNSCFYKAATQNEKRLGPGAYANSSMTIKQCYDKINSKNKKVTKGNAFSSKQDRFKSAKNQTKNYQNQESPQAHYKCLAKQSKSEKIFKQRYEGREASTKYKTGFSNYKNPTANTTTVIPKSKQCMQNIRKLNKSRKVNSIVRNDQQAVRVLLSNPKNTQQNSYYYMDKDHYESSKNGTSESKQYLTGPGQYDIGKSTNKGLKKSKSVVSWSCEKPRRFQHYYSKSVVTKAQQPGPGQYELNKTSYINQKEENRLSSSFSYGGIRSYMDTLIYKTNNQFRAKVLQLKKLKDKDPGPGQYEILESTMTGSLMSKKAESFYYGDEVMGSKAKRFAQNKEQVQIPGPGYYCKNDLNSSNTMTKFYTSNILKENRRKIFSKPNHLSQYPKEDVVPLSQQIQKNKRQFANKSQNNRMLACSLKERCHSKIGSMGKDQRFKSTTKQRKETPGPGQYSQASINFSPQKQVKRQKSGVFCSLVQRQAFQNTMSGANNSYKDIPFYDIQKTDISYKNQKIKQNIENLKRVSISKAPFESTVERFSQLGSKGKYGFQHKNYENQSAYQKVVVQLSDKRCKTEMCPSSVFASKTQRDPFKNGQKPSDISVPGPGAYAKTSNKDDFLNKKSFNVQYSDIPKRTRRMSNLKI